MFLKLSGLIGPALLFWSCTLANTLEAKKIKKQPHSNFIWRSEKYFPRIFFLNKILRKYFSLLQSVLQLWMFQNQLSILLQSAMSYILFNWLLSATCDMAILVVEFHVRDKVIYTKYSKHWPYTVALRIDCVCRKCQIMV